jgi:adenine-specific DNA-methyltransferase
LNDKPKLVGVANRREDAGDTISSSIFEEFRKNDEGQYIVVEAIEKLIKNTPAKYVILSYNNNGRATFQAIKDILKNLGKEISIFERDYKKNVMATITRTTNEWINEKNRANKEYLFIIHKNGKTEAISEIKVEKIDIRNLAPANQQKLVF